jgi:predicted HicB family RNase H-like nuclease
MDPTQTAAPPSEGEILNRARALYARRTDWVTFFREILGVKGMVRRAFPTPQTLAEFEQSQAYGEIQQMLSQLRKKSTGTPPENEPTRVITVRLPKSLHDTLKSEAHQHETSMNKLCISKLLRFIEDEYVPSDT